MSFIVIDKPEGWTSHDVVAKMRGVLHERTIGHLGTLDPLATGVLVLAVGRESTKQIQNYMKLDKEYDVEIELGKSSDTYDREGEVKVSGTVSGLTEEIVLTAMQSFWGKTMQMPPAFSAKKIQGRRAYDLARAGKTVELKPVEVEMHARDIQVELPFVRFTLTVSSGTYVRSLAHDIGETLGCGAILTRLRRTRVGAFAIKDARTIDSFVTQ